MSIIGLSEVVGTTGTDSFVGQNGHIYFGRGGADRFSLSGGSGAWFVGGSGGDVYSVNGASAAVIQEAGGGTGDRIQLDRIDFGKSTSYVGTIRAYPLDTHTHHI